MDDSALETQQQGKRLKIQGHDSREKYRQAAHRKQFLQREFKAQSLKLEFKHNKRARPATLTSPRLTDQKWPRLITTSLYHSDIL